MYGFCLEVSGPYACFTRPEMKVERVSYDVITPSAARAIFEAILWKPAIQWIVSRIEVLEPIRWISVRRNEVGARASPAKAAIFVEDDRQQRAGLLLRDVRYRLFAQQRFLQPGQRPKCRAPVPEGLLDPDERKEMARDETPAKYAAMFERRAAKGQCFCQPYLGCREFSAEFRLVSRDAPQAKRVSETRDLGWMLYDIDFSTEGSPRPMFFRARMEDGAITVPPPDSEEVRR